MPDATEPLRHELEIAAPPEVVFAYFTDPGRMVEWMGVGALLDPRPGGALRIDANGRDVVVGEYLELEVLEEPGSVARFGFGPGWAKTLELRVDALEPGRRVEWTPVGGFPGWVGTTIHWDLEPAENGGTVVYFEYTGWQDGQADASSSCSAAAPRRGSRGRSR